MRCNLARLGKIWFGLGFLTSYGGVWSGEERFGMGFAVRLCPVRLGWAWHGKER